MIFHFTLPDCIYRLDTAWSDSRHVLTFEVVIKREDFIQTLKGYVGILPDDLYIEGIGSSKTVGDLLVALAWIKVHERWLIEVIREYHKTYHPEKK